MEFILLFLFGLAVGSFLNVVSLRYEPGNRLFDRKIIGGRSHCPQCGNKLGWTELIPVVSFLVQRGKCRSCGAKISFQYPIVELLGGFIFALVPLRLFHMYFAGAVSGAFLNQFIVLSAIWILIFLALLLLSVIDIRFYIIPDQTNIFIGLLGVGLAVLGRGSLIGYYANIFSLSQNAYINHAIGAFAGAIFFSIIILITRGKGMGWGDAKLAGALGLVFGFPAVLLPIMLAFLIGTIVNIPALILGRSGMKTAIPFGPFLAIGAVAVFFFGFELLNWYFKSVELFATVNPL